MTVPTETVPQGSLGIARQVTLVQPARLGCFDITDIVAWLGGDPENISGEECLCAALYYVLCGSGYLDYCDFPVPSNLPPNDVRTRAGGGMVAPFRTLGTPAEATATLRRYRDEILAPSPVGPLYLNLFRELSGEVVIAALQSPTFLHELLAASQDWVAGIDALVNGNGDSLVLTPEMIQNLGTIVYSRSAAGSPELSLAAGNESSRLQMYNASGLTMTQLQQQVVQLGGRVPTEQESWGSLKSRFGEQEKR